MEIVLHCEKCWKLISLLYLDDMVLEADIFFFFSTSVLNVENTDQISSPASQNTIKNLEYDA